MSDVAAGAPLKDTAVINKKKRPHRKRKGPVTRVCLEVVIIRHAETDLNAQGVRVLQGQLDTEINVFGEKQAIAVANRLRHEKFDHIYTSDLLRAVHTTNIIAEHQPKDIIVKDKRLREQNLGDLTGLTWQQAKAILKKEDQYLEDHIQSKGGGESRTAFDNRIIDFYSNLIETHLVCPHTEMVEKLEKQLSSKSQRTSQISRAGSQSASLQSERISSSVDGKLTINTIAVPSANNPLIKTPSSAASPLPHPSLSPSALISHRKSSVVSLDNDASAALSMIACSKLRKQRILLVTHGGWIKHFINYLISDLEFQVLEYNLGFPHSTGVYKFTISWVPNEAFDDFEWRGIIHLMNSLGHMAKISKAVHPKLVDLEKAKKKFEAMAKKNNAKTGGKTKKKQDIDPYQELIAQQQKSSSNKSSPSHSPSLVRKALYDASMNEPGKVKRSLGW